MGKKISLLTLCALNGIKEALYLLVAPFLPEQLREKQVDELYYAPLFVSYGVTLFIASLLAGHYQQKFSRSATLRVGTLLHAVSCGCFISLKYVKAGDEILFLTMGFAGRILEGVGAGMLQTAAYGEALAQNREN